MSKNPLSHLNDRGEAHMVDVSQKSVTQRSATAQGFVSMQKTTLDLIMTGQAKKGDVLATARIAGIMAAKKTHELIPLCHPLAITKASVDFEADSDPAGDAAAGIHVTAEVRVCGQTGVEMEALTAVSVACLTIYDMLKAADKAMTFSDIKLVEKTGGRSGTFRADKGADARPAKSAAAAGGKSRSSAAAATAGQADPSSTQSGDPPPAASGDPPPAASGDPPWDI